MSPLMMRFFTLVGIALAAASMQMKARAGTLGGPEVQQLPAVISSHVAQQDWRTT
jgi:hypothetical protein